MLRLRCCASVLLEAIALACLTGCVGSVRQLKVTEASSDTIELFLDEPAGNRMSLQDHELLVTTATEAGGAGPTTRLSLGTLGRNLEGGQFLVIWTDDGHTGPPEAASFVSPGGSAPGIRVSPDFFAALETAEAVEVRVRGKHGRGMVYDRIDDCIRYGTASIRPATGGEFYNNSNAAIPEPPRGGGVSVQRKFAGARPIDTNDEEDLKAGVATFARATPP